MKSYYEEQDEITERKGKYYQEHREDKTAYQKQYYQEHKEERKRYQKQYHQEHREEAKRYQKQRREKRVYKKQGDFLKEKLEKKGKSQSWLAKQLDVSRASISYYLGGIYLLRNDSLRKRLCKILNVKPQDLEKLVEK